jgi:hypothetical protein
MPVNRGKSPSPGPKRHTIITFTTSFLLISENDHYEAVYSCSRGTAQLGVPVVTSNTSQAAAEESITVARMERTGPEVMSSGNNNEVD